MENPEFEGEIPEEYLERLAINENEAKAKVEAYYYLIQEYQSKIDALDFQINRLKAKTKGFDKIIDRLKGLVNFAVNRFGTIPPKSKSKAIITDTVKAIFINQPKVFVTNESLVPNKYRKFELTFKDMSWNEQDLIEKALKAYQPKSNEELDSYMKLYENRILNNKIALDTIKADLQEEKYLTVPIETDEGVSSIVVATLNEDNGYIRFT